MNIKNIFLLFSLFLPYSLIAQSKLLQFVEMQDPDVKGVSCYVSFKYQSLFFGAYSKDKRSAQFYSVNCLQTSSEVSGDFSTKENIFSGTAKNKDFEKYIIINRIYDKEKNILLYMKEGYEGSSQLFIIKLK